MANILPGALRGGTNLLALVMSLTAGHLVGSSVAVMVLPRVTLTLQHQTISVLATVNGHAPVGVVGVTVTEIVFWQGTTLQLVDSSSWTVFVAESSSSTAGSYSHLITVTFQLGLPVWGCDPPSIGNCGGIFDSSGLSSYLQSSFGIVIPQNVSPKNVMKVKIVFISKLDCTSF